MLVNRNKRETPILIRLTKSDQHGQLIIEVEFVVWGGELIILPEAPEYNFAVGQFSGFDTDPLPATGNWGCWIQPWGSLVRSERAESRSKAIEIARDELLCHSPQALREAVAMLEMDKPDVDDWQYLPKGTKIGSKNKGGQDETV